MLDRAQVEVKLGEYRAAIIDIEQAIAADNSPGRIIGAATLLGRSIADSPADVQPVLQQALESLTVSNPSSQTGLIFDLARYRLRGEVALAHRDAATALDQFLRADKLEAPFHSREYLARAYMLAVAHSTDRTQRAGLLRRAATVLAPTALNPATVWQAPSAYAPGFYADQLDAWLRIPSDDQVSQAQREHMIDRLNKLRPQNSPRSPVTTKRVPQTPAK